MVYPRPFLRVVASGSAWSGNETWSTGWTMARFPDETLILPIDQPEDVQPYFDAVAAWWARGASRISGYALLEMVKVNVIDVHGLYADKNNTFLYEAPTPIPGGSGSAAFAPQLSCAISLTTDVRRGPGSKGRFYPPIPSVSAEADGLVDLAHAQTMADSALTLINDLNDLGPELVSVVSAVGSGNIEQVTGVRVGRVIDTIRRRRSSIPESYVPAGGTITKRRGGGGTF
jgi:hypothetical protein